MTAAELDSLRITLDPASQAGLAFALFCVMLGVALNLRLHDFYFLKDRPRLFWGGVGAQLVLLPLATLLLLFLLSPPPSLALGMVVVAACPGGTSSNFLTFLARGDIAYSVSLTAASSLFACVATPAAILFWTSLYPPTADLLKTVEVDALAFVIQTSLLLAVPLALGMTAAGRWPGGAARAGKYVGGAGAAALGVVIVYGLIRFWSGLGPALQLIIPLAVLHNAVAFLVGGLAGRLLQAPAAARRSLVFEVGIQNSGLALVILLSQLDGLGGASAVAGVWGVWHFVAGGFIVAAYRRADRRGTQRAGAREEDAS